MIQRIENVLMSGDGRIKRNGESKRLDEFIANVEQKEALLINNGNL
jgi:hypothetical protein